MNIRPLYDRILAKRVAEQDKTTGGLFIPDSADHIILREDDILAVLEETSP
jgi:co-chaperonin GroES (HSP10)